MDGLAAALERLGEGLRTQAVRPNLLGYRPRSEAQKRFHESRARFKLFVGGNRAGKTVAGAVEALWWASGRHPHRLTPKPPVAGRVVTVDYPNGQDLIIVPELRRWAVASDLRGGTWDKAWDARAHTLHFANGSTIEVKTTDQDLDTHAGTSRHFVWFDEECPEPYWNENQARTLDVKGSMWMTMTPLEGQDWSYDRLYLPGTGRDGRTRDPDVQVVQAETWGNETLDPDEIARLAAQWAGSPDDLAARLHGEYVAVGGLIYKSFDPVLHVIEHWLPPADWPVYTSVDHGLVQAAWGWFAVDPDGRITGFHEHYEPERTIPQLADAVLSFERTALGRNAVMRVGGHDIRNRQQAGGVVVSTQLDYASCGLFIEPMPAEWETGINRVRQYLMPGPDGVPRLRFTADMPTTARQMQRLRYRRFATATLRAVSNPPEGQVKKDDHCADMVRFFLVSRPDLSMLAPTDPPPDRTPDAVGALLGATHSVRPVGSRMRLPRGTPLQGQPAQREDTWEVVSEHLGGYW